MLRLPAEAADAALARAAIGDDGGASADAVAVAIVGIGQREDRVVGDGLDEPGAEHRNRDPADDDVGVGGITGWQPWPGNENRWTSVSPAASRPS